MSVNPAPNDTIMILGPSHLLHEDAAVVDTARFHLPDGDLEIQPGDAVPVKYDHLLKRWVVAGPITVDPRVVIDE
jgi:hypothetical protein